MLCFLIDFAEYFNKCRVCGRHFTTLEELSIFCVSFFFQVRVFIKMLPVQDGALLQHCMPGIVCLRLG